MKTSLKQSCHLLKNKNIFVNKVVTYRKNQYFYCHLTTKYFTKGVVA